MAEKDNKVEETREDNLDEKNEGKKKLNVKSAAWVWILVALAFLSILFIWIIPSGDKDSDGGPEGNVKNTTVAATNDQLQVQLDSTVANPNDSNAPQVLALAEDGTPLQPEAAQPGISGEVAPLTDDNTSQMTYTPTTTSVAGTAQSQESTPAPVAAPQAAQAPAQAPAQSTQASRIEPIRYGDFSQWVTRTITESKALGGKQKTLYEIGPTATVNGNNPYSNTGGSPWATSNVYAKVAGIVKGSGTVSPANVNGNIMAKLEAKMEEVKVLGIVNMDVMVAGTIFLGQVYEPISSTKSPFSKMEMGVPYTKRPKALVFDYKVDMPATNTRTKATGFGSKQTLQGRDNAEVYVLFQKRWEDDKGNIHALRVGTGRERYGNSVPLTKGHRLPIYYGDITNMNGYMGLLTGDRTTYAKNSKGKLVPVKEEGWAPADTTPTHVMVMCSSSCGTPFVGTEGLTLYVDNIGFEF